MREGGGKGFLAAWGGGFWSPSLVPRPFLTLSIQNQIPDPDPQTTDPAPEGGGVTSPPPPKPRNP